MRRIDRRTVLRGLLGGAGVTVSLPWLEAFVDPRCARAGESIFPKRFGVFFWGNGMLPERWVPSAAGQGDEWQLSDQLQPLAAVKDLITVVTGTEVRVPNVIPHWSGTSGFLTGTEPLGEEGDFTLSSPTIDQLLAAEIGGETLYRSLETGAHTGSSSISFNGPNSSNPAETSPYALFERLFGTGFTPPGEEGQVDPRLALRRSVLDAVYEQANTLRGRVGAADRQRLDQHMDGIRDLELRLARMQEDPPDLEACSLPDAPPGDESIGTLSERNRLTCDLLVMSLACDQTRVFTHLYTKPVDNWVHPGMDSGHHQLTHDEPDPQPQVHEIVLQVMAEYAYFVEALQAVPEGDGTLLDNMVLIGTSGVSLGRTHALDEWPLILAGSCGGALRQGVHYRSATGENASSVMLSAIRAMGMLAPSYGEGEAATSDSLGAIET